MGGWFILSLVCLMFTIYFAPFLWDVFFICLPGASRSLGGAETGMAWRQDTGARRRATEDVIEPA